LDSKEDETKSSQISTSHEQLEKLNIRNEEEAQEQAQASYSSLETINKEETQTHVELDHEQIVLESFQCAIKFKSKEIKLPIIVSTFMKIMQASW
jgi:hypothetical protein